MSWKMVRTAAVAVGTAALLAAWLLWLQVAPSLSPDDVTLRGKLLPTAGLAGAQAASGEAWAAQLQVKLGKPDAAKNDVAYLYIPGFQGAKYEIVEDNRPGAIGMIPAEAIRAQVRTMLQQTGLSVSETELNEPGVSYKGTEPSYTIRVYLMPQPNGGAAAATPSNATSAASAPDTSAAASAALSTTAPDGPAYAVYIHRERRFGKNTGWTKAVKLEVQQ